ncbi:PREDICTED: uncharacterized protein LOC109395164 [Hipposideros armiger]|uniref:Uncharacterized protein LOC109395164 n=1 Tax=Hipposideros armiger TaxID=186990 RepID=A0A8B7T753_HIPAR|nr:PREDICTED: uncharacterized protein LOC109395164 [Hipposideros armiger]
MSFWGTECNPQHPPSSKERISGNPLRNRGSPPPWGPVLTPHLLLAGLLELHGDKACLLLAFPMDEAPGFLSTDEEPRNEGGEGAASPALPVEGAARRRGPQPTPPTAGNAASTLHASTGFPVPGRPLPPLQVLFPTSCHQEAQERAGVTPQHLGTGASDVSSACILTTGRAQRKAVTSPNLAGSWGPFSCHHCRNATAQAACHAEHRRECAEPPGGPRVWRAPRGGLQAPPTGPLLPPSVYHLHPRIPAR